MKDQPYIDEPLAICHLIGGSNGIPWDQELSEEQIKAHVAKCIRVWYEIQSQLADRNSRAPRKRQYTGIEP